MCNYEYRRMPFLSVSCGQKCVAARFSRDERARSKKVLPPNRSIFGLLRAAGGRTDAGGRRSSSSSNDVSRGLL